LKKSRSRKSRLTVSVRRSAGRIVDLDVSGHAAFAPLGRDIVCAATSALVLSAAHGVSVHCRASVRVIDDGAGDYRLHVVRGGNARAQAVLESTLSGLQAIARSYPGTLEVRVVAGKPSSPPKRSAPVRSTRK
jgi:uncharacterized protein YsxB (DUF464 family)